MCSKISPWPCWCWGPPWGWGWPQDPTQMCGGVRKKFQMANFTMPTNMSAMKYLGWPKVHQSPKTFRDTSPTRVFCQILEKNALKHPKN